MPCFMHYRFIHFRRSIMGLLLGVLTQFSTIGQPDEDWMKELLVNPSVNLKKMTGNTFLAQLKPEAYLNPELKNRFKPVRRLDGNWLVVQSDSVGILMAHATQIYPVNDKWKWSKSIFSLPKGKKVSFLVDFISNDKQQIHRTAQKYQLHRITDRYYQGFGKRKLLAALAKESCVSFLSLESLEAQEESRVIDLNLNANVISRIHAERPDLNGEGVIISVKENAYNSTDLDLRGRSTPSGLEAESLSNHATEMATIIAGAGNSFITGRGVARGAHLTGASFEVLFPEAKEDYDRLGVHLQNHSYGTEVENFYGLSAQAYDESTQNDSTLIHVFSIGNSGQEVPVEGKYTGIGPFANMTGNFKSAKNVLTIGAVDSVGRSQVFSSRGPTFDGRVKPDLSAYSMVGSSNSAAMVSGTLALLQQSFKNQTGQYPASSLLRALLVTGCEDLDAPGPDYERGFGMLNAYRSLSLLSSGQFVNSSLNANHTDWNYDLEVDATVAQVTIALVWNDPPGNPGDQKPLINDLDLQVISPSGQVYLPWVLDSSPDVDRLKAPAVRRKDVATNTVEVVSFLVEESGTYQLQVSGTLLTEKQSYSVVYRADTLNTFEWNYPVKGANMPYNGETGTYFRWENTLSSPTGSLIYSYLGNSDWQVLDAAVNLKQKSWRWEEADRQPAGVVTAAMVVGVDTFKTEPFTISSALSSSVGFNCGDSLLLAWENVNGVASYAVRQPGDQYLEDYQLLQDTSLLIYSPDNPFFSITPMLQDYQLLPTYTFDYQEQAAGCFVKSFFQEVDVEMGIYLNLQLSSTYGINNLRIESWKNQRYELLYESTTIKENERVLDAFPNQGYNKYRLTIEFINGQMLQEEIGDTYYLTEKDVLVFPNPIKSGDQLFVYSRENASLGRCSVYDVQGRLVLDQELQSTREAISVHDLRPGLYTYIITLDGRQNKGKLLVNE